MLITLNAHAQDADDLFNQSLARWGAGKNDSKHGLTKFALIHLDQKTKNENKFQGGVGQFMLFNALTYGYNDEYWWSKVSNSRDKLLVSNRLLVEQNEVIAVRVLNHLVRDQNLHMLPVEQSAKVAASVLELVSKSTNRRLSRKLLSSLRVLLPSTFAWGNSTLSPELSTLLGELVLDDSDLGDQAARLVGQLRSQSVVKYV